MYFNIVNSDDFKKIMQINLSNIIGFLLESETEFGVLVDMKAVDFDPLLPDDLTLGDPSYFVLGGYTLQSAAIENETLVFEAGFGEDNFGSTVTLPLASILQISLDNKAIAINMAPSPTQKPSQVKQEEQKHQKHSMNVFASNPENEKFFKK